jgi:hypothetical protein
MTKKRKPEEQDPNTDLFTNEDHSEEDLSWMIEDTVTEKKNKNGKEI